MATQAARAGNDLEFRPCFVTSAVYTDDGRIVASHTRRVGQDMVRQTAWGYDPKEDDWVYIAGFDHLSEDIDTPPLPPALATPDCRLITMVDDRTMVIDFFNENGLKTYEHTTAFPPVGASEPMVCFRQGRVECLGLNIEGRMCSSIGMASHCVFSGETTPLDHVPLGRMGHTAVMCYPIAGQGVIFYASEAATSDVSVTMVIPLVVPRTPVATLIDVDKTHMAACYVSAGSGGNDADTLRIVTVTDAVTDAGPSGDHRYTIITHIECTHADGCRVVRHSVIAGALPTADLSGRPLIALSPNGLSIFVAIVSTGNVGATLTLEFDSDHRVVTRGRTVDLHVMSSRAWMVPIANGATSMTIWTYPGAVTFPGAIKHGHILDRIPQSSQAKIPTIVSKPAEIPGGCVAYTVKNRAASGQPCIPGTAPYDGIRDDRDSRRWVWPPPAAACDDIGDTKKTDVQFFAMRGNTRLFIDVGERGFQASDSWRVGIARDATEWCARYYIVREVPTRTADRQISGWLLTTADHVDGIYQVTPARVDVSRRDRGSLFVCNSGVDDTIISHGGKRCPEYIRPRCRGMHTQTAPMFRLEACNVRVAGATALWTDGEVVRGRIVLRTTGDSFVAGYGHSSTAVFITAKRDVVMVVSNADRTLVQTRGLGRLPKGLFYEKHMVVYADPSTPLVIFHNSHSTKTLVRIGPCKFQSDSDLAAPKVPLRVLKRKGPKMQWPRSLKSRHQR